MYEEEIFLEPVDSNLPQEHKMASLHATKAFATSGRPHPNLYGAKIGYDCKKIKAVPVLLLKRERAIGVRQRGAMPAQARLTDVHCNVACDSL